MRIDIRRSEAIKNGTSIVGNTVNVKIVKNKVAPPFRSCQIDIIFGKGINRNGEILELGVEKGILTKSGSWFEYNGERFANGKDQGRRYLEEHPEIADELIAKIKEN